MVRLNMLRLWSKKAWCLWRGSTVLPSSVLPHGLERLY
uniref:PANC n=1 Tax=Arundo donax TaxID=35708 RepID=A0A0A9BQG2_ARUDO